MSDAAAAGGRWPIVLVGLPGAGKSTVGRLLAADLAVPFIDLDETIEQRAGMTVAELFASRGESAFRELERSATRDLVRRRAVVAAGGGWMVDPANAALLRPGAVVVHLRVDPSTALGRIGGAVADRPLLSGADPLAALREIGRARAARYADADLEVSTEGVTPQGVAAVLRDAVRSLDRSVG